jgi:endogenous inhibitor of DNA gyrase (YacG/DUF329 family)
MSAPSARRVPCPRCRAPSLFAAANPWRPFCSERCASIDLGAWASESYRVEAAAPADPQAPEAPPAAPH